MNTNNVTDSIERWSDKETPPDVVNVKQNVFSVDVLVYFDELDEHTIGWFDYVAEVWFFLTHQDYGKNRFKWRYFRDEVDKYKFKN